MSLASNTSLTNDGCHNSIFSSDRIIESNSTLHDCQNGSCDGYGNCQRRKISNFTENDDSRGVIFNEAVELYESKLVAVCYQQNNKLILSVSSKKHFIHSTNPT